MVTSLAMLHVRQVEHRQTDRQYVIPSLVGSENLCQIMNGSVETACVTKTVLSDNTQVDRSLPVPMTIWYAGQDRHARTHACTHALTDNRHFFSLATVPLPDNDLFRPTISTFFFWLVHKCPNIM